MPIAPNRRGETIATVNARDLHAALMVGRDFSNWIKGRIAEYGFIEGRDFVTVEGLSSPDLASAKARAQKTLEYCLSLDMAKELGMVGGELRALDVDLAERLGFGRPRKIRDLIARWLPELDKLGGCPAVGRVVSGNEVDEFYLNRKQAIFITGKSDTPAW